MSTTGTAASVRRGSDRSGGRRRTRTRTLRVRPVSLEWDETESYFLVFVSPTIEGQSLGLGYHRARLPKCSCFLTWNGKPSHLAKGDPKRIPAFSGTGDRCRMCQGWDLIGATGYLRKLLRSYPTVRMAVPEPEPRWCVTHQTVDDCWTRPGASRAR